MLEAGATTTEAMNGSWAPCSRILYGIVTYPFQPLGLMEDEVVTANDQVALEIGDEVYTLELFRPDAAPLDHPDWDGTWHRGFLVTGPKTHAEGQQESTDAVQVFFGIWPSLNVRIREELDQVPLQKLSDQLQQTPQTSPRGPGALQRSASGTQRYVMEPLQEEDEEESPSGTTPNGAGTGAASSNNAAAASSKRLSAGSLQTASLANAKQRNRLSIASVASATSPSLSLAVQELPREALSTSQASAQHKPSPPLPSLKCGDETACGVREPLVDEVACALREWAQLLYAHLAKRDYAQFHQIKREMDSLHQARRQLLSGALSRQESEQVRFDLVRRLALGNQAQGLDLIVRHPLHGSLVDIDTPGPSWVSAVQLYSMQAKLANLTTLSEDRQHNTTRLSTQTSELFSALNSRGSGSKGHDRKDSALSMTRGGDQTSTTATAASLFYHIYLDVRQIEGTPCAPGEHLELSFSIYNASDRKFISEEFCVILTHQNLPVHLTVGKLRTLFKDLTSQDLAEPLYLVCRVVKNGTFKAAASTAAASNASSPSLLAAQASTSDLRPGPEGSRASLVPSMEGIEGHHASMLRTISSTGQQSARRPLGCAVLDLSFVRTDQATASSLKSTPLANPTNTPSKDERSMPVFMPVSESSFASLHEDIIASRTETFASQLDRIKSIQVTARVYHGVAAEIAEAQPDLLHAPLTERLGFADVVEPEMQRNDLYIRLGSGLFESAGHSPGGSGSLRRGIRNLQQLASATASNANVEVTVEVRQRNGSLVEDCLSRGAGEPLVSVFTSLVIKGCPVPAFNELFKVVLPPKELEHCHLFFNFRNRASKDRNTTGVSEKPFAFAWLPLFPDDVTCLSDGKHELQLYRYHSDAVVPAAYFNVASHQIAVSTESKRASTLRSPSQFSILPSSASQLSLNAATSAQAAKLTTNPQPLRDSLTITSLSCSTHFSQDETLLKLLRWQGSSEIFTSTEDVASVLSKLKYCSETEIAKHIQPVLDALFAILTSKFNVDRKLDSAVFGNLVSIYAIILDRRFHNFKIIVDRYLTERFAFTAYSHLLKGMHQLLSDHSATGEAPQALRAAIKVWPLLFRTIIRSRELQRGKTVGSGVTSDSIEAAFKREMKNIFVEINKIMTLTAPASIIGTQVLAMQHFADIIDTVQDIFTKAEVLDMVIDFCESISSNAAGKLATHKLLLLARISEGFLLNTPSDRATLIPDLLRWIRPHFVKPNEFELRSMTEAAKVNAQIQWLEAARAAVVVLAAMLHKMHVALVDPAISSKESALTGEQDNLEFMMGLLPKLLEYYADLRSDSLLQVVQSNPTQTAAASASPPVFPTANPFYLLSQQPAESNLPEEDGVDEDTAPTSRSASMRHLRGEVAAVVLSMLHLCRPNVITNFLEATLEVEGSEHFVKLLGDLFRFERMVIEEDAFPGRWLNFNLVAHRVVLKTIECLAPLMQREWIPSQDSTYLFNYTLWREFLEALFTLLKSKQLVIEEFAPQKRRTVWRQAGDLRGAGAMWLGRLWNSLGWADSKVLPGQVTSLGGYQVQLSPPFIDSVLELCLSHHDELRTTAVHVLFSILIGESRLNSDLVSIQNQVIDTLDRLFSQKKGDEVSRGFFISQLRALFEQASVDEALSSQIDRFLDATSHFLDLLLGIRNLPPGDEFLDDRIIGTLRLMSYIRDISSSQIFCKYVHRLKDYHVQCGNFTEAGLVLKLHADLYDYDSTAYVDAIPEYGFPRQSQFARKEALYLQILELLNRGKAWESALVICKELQDRYELVNFAYQRLSEILLHQSTLYSNIVKETRTYPNCFRVGYYGKGFPATVQNRQFVYRGNEGEKFGAFRERHMNKHPSAMLLDYQSIPDEDLQNSDGQYIQICQVTPEPDRSFPIFQNPDVPTAVRAYYEHNGTNVFSFETKFSKASADQARNTSVSTDFLSTWSLRTSLMCADAFPTVLKRTEVVETRYLEISPVEKALKDVEKNATELQSLVRKYSTLKEEGSTRINANPLTMALNAVVDPGTSTGVALYRKAFFGPDFIVANPEKSNVVAQLKSAIDELTMTIHRALILHGEVCAPDMLPFHETLQDLFYKNFASEIQNLVHDDTNTVWTAEAGGGSGRSEQAHDSQSYILPQIERNASSPSPGRNGAPPKIPAKNRNRYSVSLGQDTFGDRLGAVTPSTSPSKSPNRHGSAQHQQAHVLEDGHSVRSRPISPAGTDANSVFSDSGNTSKIKRAGSLLRFGSITAKRPSPSKRGTGSIKE